MTEEMQRNDEISLVEIFKILWKKWLVLLLTLIVGLGAGVLVGVVKNANKTYYGTTVMFYVNPVKDSEDSSVLPVYGSYGDNVTDTMVVLLESEFFAKEILSGIANAPEATDENGKINSQYQALLRKIQESTSFANKDTTKAEGVAQPNNIFYAEISVFNDEGFAQLLLERLQDEAVEFIETNMPVPNGYDSTKCIPITVINEIHELNAGNMADDMVKFGLLLGAASFIVGCVVVIIVSRTKKKGTYED